ncbi:MAG: type II secretion system F family protein [Dehalococcoidia bacterium]|nr:type II secretion system F family protein [Dehalococcoidia bacterium]
MDPLLALIGVTLTATIALGSLYAFEQVTGERAVVRRRITGQRDGLRLTSASVLRANRSSRLPLVDRLPLSPQARERMQTELERAGKPLKVSEFLALRLVLALAGALVTYLTLGPRGVHPALLVLAASTMLMLGWMLPRIWLSRQRQQRQRRIEEQLPDALTAIAKSLRAGTGLLQALAYAANETEAPLGPELQATLRDLQLGAEPADVFGELAERINLPDLDIAVTAILIQRQVGGNLSEILMNVTNTIRERAKLQAEVRVLTARQRLTANLIALLPILVAAAFIGLNPDMGMLLIDTTAGRIALAVGLAFEVFGILLIRRLSVIEV